MNKKTPNNPVQLYGELHVEVTDLDGNIKRTHHFYNDIVSWIDPNDNNKPYGTAIIATMLINIQSRGINRMRIGTGTTATTDRTTQLEAEVEGLHVPAIPVRYTETQGVVQFYTTDEELPNDTYHEFGFFVDEALFARVVNNTGVRKVSGENISWKYTINVTKS